MELGESAIPLLDKILQSRLLLTKAGRRRFVASLAAPEELISTCRYIAILDGSLKYSTNGSVANFGKGTLLYVPAWIRRTWWVPRGEECSIVWCEFSIPSYQSGHELLRLSGGAHLEIATLERILTLWCRASHQGPAGTWPSTLDGWKNIDSLSLLIAEGELKASLARFLPRAQVPQAPRVAGKVHPEIRRLMSWLEKHHGEPNALEHLFEETNLSPNHLRLLFKTQIGMPPAQALKSIRLRQARDLLVSTKLSIKEIAATVGIDDNLYFSKLYHSFWGQSPSEERTSNQSAWKNLKKSRSLRTKRPPS